MEDEERGDWCVECQKTYETETWPKCPVDATHHIGHVMGCSLCGRLMLQITDDDYCGPEFLACPDCARVVKGD